MNTPAGTGPADFADALGAVGGLLNNVAMQRLRGREHHAAMAASADAVAHRREQVGLVAEMGDTDSRAGLALTLWTFAEVRVAVAAELSEALAAIEEAVVIYEPLAAMSPPRHTAEHDGARDMLGHVTAALATGVRGTA